MIANIINMLRALFGFPSLSDNEVAAILDQRARNNPEHLEWRTSVVDLMKLTSMDSSLENRKMKALQYGWSGQTGTSEMNQFLHDKILQTLRRTLLVRTYGS